MRGAVAASVLGAMLAVPCVSHAESECLGASITSFVIAPVTVVLGGTLVPVFVMSSDATGDTRYVPTMLSSLLGGAVGAGGGALYAFSDCGEGHSPNGLSPWMPVMGAVAGDILGAIVYRIVRAPRGHAWLLTPAVTGGFAGATLAAHF